MYYMSKEMYNRCMKPNYFIIPIITFIVSMVENWITSGGLQWYRLSIVEPGWTPTGPTIGLIWTMIYICATISALIAYNKVKPEDRLMISGLFLFNAVLSIGWILMYSGGQMTGLAVIESIMLCLSVVWLMWKIWPVSRTGSVLLAPYFAWGVFFVYLDYVIWILNK